MWFTKLIKQFFFWIDKIVYNFISSIYDLMITIARTSPLTQADISEMAERIYMLLAVFMIFKVTLSLITYVVNPDEFSDKSKGVSKLGTNIVISLALLVLTPYIFNYAYQLQTIILEDNSLATLIFGESEDGKTNTSFFNTAGDDIAFMTMSAFLSPNLSLKDKEYDLSSCVNLFEKNAGNNVFDNECHEAMNHFINEQTILDNYKAAVENSNLGLLLRQDLVLATANSNNDEETFIMDYKFIFSTVVGVVVVLLLLTFCMDVAIRSIKLSFLQLIAPIPILSYVDPKSGKDGMFKKWYEMCFKTYLSLFIRLLALYFAVFIISKVADMKMVDLVDGSYQTNTLVGILIIIGALMFAKQLPKMLEGLGIKLDGDGKFFLNPLKRFEEQAFAGKNITGAARGAAVGLAGAMSGAGLTRGITGAWRGMTSGKGWKETGKAEAEMNRKMRQAKLDGSNFGGRMGARFAAVTGLISESEEIAAEKNRIEKDQRQFDDKIKSIEDHIAPTKKSIAEQKHFADSVKAMEDRAVGEIEQGNSWVGSEYKIRKKNEEFIENNIGKSVDKTWAQRDIDYADYRIKKAQKEQQVAIDKGDQVALARAQASETEAQRRKADALNNLGQTTSINVTNEDAAWASSMAGDWLKDEGMKVYMTDASSGVIDDASFRNMRETAVKAGKTIGVELGKSDDPADANKTVGELIHSQLGKSKGESGKLQRDIYDDERTIENIKVEKAKLGDDLRDIAIRERKAKANENAIK